MSGWVKLHRKALNSDIRRTDPTAWRLFETLLLIVNKSTGSWSGGRHQLAMADGVIKPTTIFKALKRLEKAKMVTLVSNNRYSTIYICNWKEYQSVGNSSSNNKVTTKEQPSNTLTRIENKNKEKTVIPIPLKETIKDYEEHRAKLKAPLSERAKKLIIAKLEKLSPNDYETQNKILEQSIENGWRGVFELKESKKENSGWF